MHSSQRIFEENRNYIENCGMGHLTSRIILELSIFVIIMLKSLSCVHSSGIHAPIKLRQVLTYITVWNLTLCLVVRRLQIFSCFICQGIEDPINGIWCCPGVRTYFRRILRTTSTLTLCI